MKPTRIFLDLDDVLNCFTMSALQHVGCPVGEREYSAFKPVWGWDIVTAANNLHPSRKFTEAEFWQSIDRSLWATVLPSDEYQWLPNVCSELVGSRNVFILSSPTLDPDSLAGKLEWLQTYWPEDMRRQFLIGPPKYLCAGYDALLIDDSAKNVSTFLECGGRAILVPRPWNRLHDVDTRTYILASLDMIFNQGNA